MGLITTTYRLKTRLKLYILDTYRTLHNSPSQPKPRTPPPPKPKTKTPKKLNPLRPQRLNFELRTLTLPPWIRQPLRKHMKEYDCPYWKELAGIIYYSTFYLPDDASGKAEKRQRSWEEMAWFERDWEWEEAGDGEYVECLDAWVLGGYL